MSKLYRTIKELILNSTAWSLDYFYVSFWQVHGFLFRSDFKKYLTPKEGQVALKTPIVIIPGIYENWQFMKPIVDALYDEGYPVHIVSALGYNRADVETMAKAVSKYVEEITLHNYIIVAHSKGGLIAKSLLTGKDEPNIKGVVALNTPFSGSRYAYLTPLKTLRIFLPHSPILKTLAKNTTVNKKIISIYGLFDPHIPNGSFLKGAQNIQLNTRGHFRIMNNSQTHQAVLSAVESLNN